MCVQLELFTPEKNNRETLKILTNELAYKISHFSEFSSSINENALYSGLKLFSEILNAVEDYEKNAFNTVGTGN